jgi:hypothetical protein
MVQKQNIFFLGARRGDVITIMNVNARDSHSMHGTQVLQGADKPIQGFPIGYRTMSVLPTPTFKKFMETLANFSINFLTVGEEMMLLPYKERTRKRPVQ